MPRGFAIQSRVNLELVARDGSARSTAGTLTTFEPPSGAGVRVDTHGYTGCTTGARFDSLLATVATHAVRGDFAAAASRAGNALAEFTVVGAGTNIAFLRAVLRHPEFRTGAFTTAFLESYLEDLVAPASSGDERPAGPDGTGCVIAAPFAGTVVAVEVQAGAEVGAGAPPDRARGNEDGTRGDRSCERHCRRRSGRRG